MTYLNQFNNELHCEIIKLCHSLKLKKHDYIMGSKLFDNYQRVAVLLLFAKSGKSIREFLFDFKESKWRHWLKLKKYPARSTLHDWLKTFNLDFLRKLLQSTIYELKPSIVAIDGSGIETQYQSPYYTKRLNDFGFRKPKSPWHKLDIIVDVIGKEKYILDFSFLLTNRHDSKVAWQLFKRFKWQKLTILADKGYYWFDLFDLAKSKNNILVVPPKNYGSKGFGHPKAVRTNIKKAYSDNEDKYRLRNNVESVFSSLKRVQGLRIRARLAHMKKKEMAWQMIWYNIRKKISLRIIFLLKIILFSLKNSVLNQKIKIFYLK